MLRRDEKITGKLVFLGTGTSHGVPVIGCGCPTCLSDNPKNNRTRCSVVLGLPEGNLLIDTTPELRVQLLRERIGAIHAVLYTHEHADHLFGLDDLRIFPEHLGHEIPIYCEESVERRIRTTFDYAFDPAIREYPAGGVPRLVFRRIATEPFSVLAKPVVPIRLRHGPWSILGYRFDRIAYCTDVKHIPPESMTLLEGLDVLILGCLRREPHATHLSLDEAVAVARRLAPRRTIFTHMCHRLEHEAVSRELPPGMELGYDGMTIPL
ncbi:MAG: MBL fold metallo-hydrolase [Planctomycetia bacterium]|nr:MBL fold metallo-hydrolase [Planctomycetia bacterium]